MEAIAEEIISCGDQTTVETLDKFLDTAASVFNFPELDQNDTREKLWNALYQICLKADNKVVEKALSSIRILSRDKTSLGKLANEDLLLLFKKLAGLEENFTFTDQNVNVAIETEKCLSNICLNSISCAKACYENGIVKSLVDRIKNYKDITNEDIRYFDAKLLFIISAVRPELRKVIRDELDGIKYLAEELDGITKPDKTNVYLTDMEIDIACELLRALFNITLHVNENDEVEVEKFTNLVVILRKLLLIKTVWPEKRVVLQNDVINLLTNMPNKSYSKLLIPAPKGVTLPKYWVYENMDMMAYYEILTVLKGKFTRKPTVTKQHEILSPLISVLLKSATSDRIIRKYLKLQILPPLKDVHTLPEEGNELRNHLCKLLTTPITDLRDIVAELLFVLCKRNVTRMVKYTGYGNAAGLFAQRGLLGGKRDNRENEFSSDDADSETDEYAEYKHGINPIVGRYEEPRQNPMENMTEEQKEYEALKLVQLIDDMTKYGTIKPCRIGEDGKPEPIEHVLQLQERIKGQSQNHNSDDSD